MSAAVAALSSAAVDARASETFDHAVARMLPLARITQEREALRERYLAAKPFPHLVLDGYFDEQVLDRLAADFPSRDKRDWLNYDTADEVKQTSRGMASLSPYVQAFLLQMNSEPWMEQMRLITGVADMVGDPLYLGGGLHESFRGGWLNAHVDWTQHGMLPMVRRANMIVYLNRNWDPAWGGALELYDPVTKKAEAKVEPFFNRAVIFPTREDTYHGFPEPITCPEDRTRKSVSLFYWSPKQEALKEGMWIRFMPGTKQTRAISLLRQFVPPIVYTARYAVRDFLKGKRAGKAPAG